LLFSGNMGYHPNVDAVLYFGEQILPHIWRAVPNAQFTVVGTNPPPAVRRLARDPRITITGYVSDIRPFFNGASVAVCPLRIGAGIQNKLLEALSMGIPVVATPLAAGGTAVEPETHVLLAENPQAFAQQTIRLLADPRLGSVLSKSGRKFVEERYDWKTNLRDLEPIFFPSRAVFDKQPPASPEKPENAPLSSSLRIDAVSD
jgi:glycosyltransferase involved in cell wall biosynthesis